MMRIACLALCLVGCTDFEFELDLTTPGTFSVEDDGTTLVASACPGGAFLGCVADPEMDTVSLTVAGTSVDLPYAAEALFAGSFTASIPSPASRDAQFRFERPEASEGAVEGSVDIELLPAFALNIQAPTSRSELLQVDAERFPGGKIGLQLTTTCSAGSESYTIDDDDSATIRLDGQGTCEHILIVTQTVTSEDAYVVESSRLFRTVFTTSP